MYMRLVDDIILNGQIFVDKIGAIRVVGHYSADFGGGQKYILWFFCSKEIGNSLLIAQIQLLGCACDNILKTEAFEFIDNSRTYHSAMPCYIYFCVFFHNSVLIPTNIRLILRFNFWYG